MPLLNDSDAVYLGGTPLDAVYLGAEKVWPTAPVMSPVYVVNTWWASSANGVVTLKNPVAGGWETEDVYIYFVASQASTAITGFPKDMYTYDIWPAPVPAEASRRFLWAGTAIAAFHQPSTGVTFTVQGATTARTIGICVQVRGVDPDIWDLSHVPPQKVQGSLGAGYLEIPAVPAGRLGLAVCHTTNSANAGGNLHTASTGWSLLRSVSVPGDGTDTGTAQSTNRLSVWQRTPTPEGLPVGNMQTNGNVAAGATALVAIL